MKLSLSLNARVTMLAAVLLPILLWLGNWQLERAAEKRAVQALYEQRRQEDPIPLGQLELTTNSDDVAFRSVQLRGEFDNRRTFLLDNRVQKGQVGYEVLSPLRTSSGSWVLVNRGWIKGDPARRQLPEVSQVDGEVSTMGEVYVPLGDPFLLAEQVFEEVDWPLVVQAVEMDKFADLLNVPLFPYVVRLRGEAVGALQPNWQPVNVEPQKHLGYAVQWFGMALALVIWFIFANTNLAQVLKSYGTTARDRSR